MIPLAKDTREAIGAFAEHVENRSLLFEKMVLSKSVLHDVDRFNDAQRFNVLRATEDGDRVLQEEASSARHYASRGGQNAAAATYKARVAIALSTIRVNHPELVESRIRSANRFLLDLEKAYSGRAVTFVATLGGRLLINMAGGVMENSGLALDRITGVPFIPGTAVKGITRHCALWEIRSATDPTAQILLLREAMAIFGFASNDLGARGDLLWAVDGKRSFLDAALEGFDTDTYKGTCAFIAASPSRAENLAVVAEVLTPHFDNSLRPIFFPAVEAGSEFGFAIIAQREPYLADLSRSGLLERAKGWLQAALTRNGIGAKTGAGYGWFQIDPQAEDKRRQELMLEQERIALEKAEAAQRAEDALAASEAARSETQRRASLSDVDREAEDIGKLEVQEFAELAKRLGEEGQEKQRAFLKVLLTSSHKDTRKRWKKNKPEIWNSVLAVAAALNVDLP